MQYVMLVRVDPDLAATWAGEDPGSWVEEGNRTGMRIKGNALEDPDTATTVRVRDGKTLVSDGPFAETKEYVAGYDLLEAENLEQAVDYAARHPVAAFGALEVREVWSDFVAESAVEHPAPAETGADYLFLHIPDHDLLATTTRAEGDPTAWVRDTEARRVTLGGFRLKDPASDTSALVRRRAGETFISRGPFAETIEEVAGIDRMRVADLDEALVLAAAHPTARIGAIDVRPFRTA